MEQARRAQRNGGQVHPLVICLELPPSFTISLAHFEKLSFPKGLFILNYMAQNYVLGKRIKQIKFFQKTL